MRPEELGRDDDASDGVPWLAVTPQEVPGLMAAYRQARALAQVVRALLMASGIPDAELPVIVAGISAEGSPVVRIGDGTATVGVGARHRRDDTGACGRNEHWVG